MNKINPTEAEFRRFLKPSSAKTYSADFNKFLKETGLTLEDFKTLPVNDIIEQVKDFIYKYQGILAPRHLNVVKSSVIKWLWIIRRIKNPKEIEKISFDGTSLKGSWITEKSLETKDVKAIMDLANGKEKVAIGLIGLSGLRPSLLSYLRIRDILPSMHQIINGKLAITQKPCIILVPRFDKDDNGRIRKDENNKDVKITGNKADFEFFAIIQSHICTLIEETLNTNIVTENTKLCDIEKSKQLNYLVNKYYDKLNPKYTGRPYDLRNFYIRHLERVFEKLGEHNLAQVIQGHKPTVQGALYPLRGLLTNREEQERIMTEYKELDEFFNSEIFGESKPQTNQNDTINETLKKLGISAEQLATLLNQLTQNKTNN